MSSESVFSCLQEPDTICFGLDRPTDERSLVALLRRLAADDLLVTLIPRLDSAEIEAVEQMLFGLLKHHLSHQEYHRLFLRQQGE